MSINVTAQDVDRTGLVTTRAQWGVASVVMAGSAASAWVAFGQLGEHPAIGAITAVGVDLALASGLVIGRRLRAVGITTVWGTVLLWLTSTMTLLLNSGASAVTGHWVLAGAHAFLPVLLVVLTEAGSEAQLKLLRLQRDTTASELAAVDAQLVADRAAREAQQMEHREAGHRRAAEELATAQSVHDQTVELRRVAAQAHAEETALRATTDTELTATKTVGEQLVKTRRKQTEPVKPARDGPVASREERRQWVRDQRTAGRNPTGAEVDDEFGPPVAGSKSRTGAAIVAEVDVEFRRAAVHAVKGGR